MTDSPPDFAYYPDAIADGRVHETDKECAACNRARGWISDALLYSATKPADAYFCPWCIADGAAVRVFGDRSTRWMTVSPTMRQPGSSLSGGEEIRAYPEALAALLADLKQYEWGRDEKHLADFIDGLGGGQVAYLFQCPSCEKPMVMWDAD